MHLPKLVNTADHVCKKKTCQNDIVPQKKKTLIMDKNVLSCHENVIAKNLSGPKIIV